MDHMVGVWWSGNDDDARPAGPEAKGYSSLDLNAVGTDFPVIQDILKYVVDKGKSQITSKDKVGENFYNRAVCNSVLIAEAIRNAQKITGKKVVNGDDVRRGLESARHHSRALKELGMEGFAAPVKLSCADHNGTWRYLAGRVGRHQVDPRCSDSIQPIKDKVLPLIDSTAKEYVKANAGWPKRTEPCDKSS